MISTFVSGERLGKNGTGIQNPIPVVRMDKRKSGFGFDEAAATDVVALYDTTEDEEEESHESEDKVPKGADEAAPKGVEKAAEAATVGEEEAAEGEEA